MNDQNQQQISIDEIKIIIGGLVMDKYFDNKAANQMINDMQNQIKEKDQRLEELEKERNV